MPVVPVQDIEYVDVAMIAETVFEPDVARVPDHEPEAVQAVALVEDHVRVGAVLYETLPAEVDMVAVGATIILQAVPERVYPVGQVCVMTGKTSLKYDDRDKQVFSDVGMNG